MSELTGRELDRAIAEALGLNPQWSGEPYNNWWYSITGDDDLVMLSTSIPRYHADLNAVAAVCAERGWDIKLTYDKGVSLYRCAIHAEYAPARFGTVVAAKGATWAEAAARALYAALTAG